MTDIYNINNTLYTTHINPKFYSDLFLTAFIKLIICLPGIVNNLALICVTFREKSLRGPCNLLLTLGALFELIYLSGFTIPFLLALTTINFITLQTCFYIQAIPLISLFASVNTVLFVGIDRLLNVILPIKYHTINKPIYFTIILFGILAYPFYAVSLAIDGVWSNYNRLVICITTEPYNFYYSTQLLDTGFFINLTSFICYLFVWYFVSKANNVTNNHNHRIFKSVLYIMFLVVGTWTLFTIWNKFIPSVLTDNFSTQYITPAVNFLSCEIASSSNVFILFACSSKYRNAFKRLAFDLPIVGKLFKGESASANNVIQVKPPIHLKPTFLRTAVYPKN